MRLNPLNGRWVTIVSDRAHRPRDFAPRQPAIEADPDRPCPFCPGNEDATLPALDAVDGGGPWQMRVIPNLYPAFGGGHRVRRPPRRAGPRDRRGDRHPRGLRVLARPRRWARATLDDDQRRRADAGPQAPPRRPCRVDQASATPRSSSTTAARPAPRSPIPHAQILGLPFVPTEILDEERAFARFAGGCVICTTIDAEELSGERVVFADADVVCVAPFWSGAPYELLLMPRRHEGPPAGRRRRQPRGDGPGDPRRRRPSSTRRSATSPSTSASTAPRTSTPASTTGTSTSGRTSSPRRDSSGAPA